MRNKVVNKKELIAAIKEKMNNPTIDVDSLFESSIEIMVKDLTEGKCIAIQGFGIFDVKKKNERISVNPITKERSLVPPKLSLVFKPSSVIKLRINKDLIK